MEKAPLLYYYAHRYLRDMVFKQTDTFMSVVKAGSKVLEQKLRETFDIIKNDEKYPLSEKDIELQPEDFTTSVSALDNNLHLLLIKFPEPRNTTEVYYVGITLEKEPKYYTLELHIPVTKEPIPENYQYFVCGWTKDGQHNRYAKDLSEPKPGFFSSAINELLSPDKQSK